MSNKIKWNGAPYQIVETESGDVITRKFFYRGTYYPNNPKRVLNYEYKKGLENYCVIGGPYWSSDKVNRMVKLIGPMKRELSFLEQEGFNSSPVRNLDLPLSSHKTRRQEEIDFLTQWGKATGEFSIYKDHTDFGMANQRYEFWVRVPANKQETC